MKASVIADVSLCRFETWVSGCLGVGLNLQDRE